MSPPLLAFVCLLLCGTAAAKNYQYYLKRTPGVVDAVCLTSKDKPKASYKDMDAFYVGSSKNVPGSGKLCSAPVVTIASFGIVLTPLQGVLSLPRVVATTVFNASLWTASRTDTVTLDAFNGVPDRPLALVGTPHPVELAALDPNDPTASTAKLTKVPVSSFRGGYAEDLKTIENYLGVSVTSNTIEGLQSAIIISSHTDTDGFGWKASYFVFQVEANGTVSGYLFVAIFAVEEDPGILLEAYKTRGRQLSLREPRKARRSLLQYDYYGGTDKSKSQTCPVLCSWKIIGGKKVYKCTCIL